MLDAAKKESLVVYGSTNPVISREAANFPQKYGFKVDYVALQSGDTQTRTQAEADSGKRIASITMTGDTAIYQLEQAGILQPLKALPNAANLSPNAYIPIQQSKGFYVPYGDIAVGLLVNTGQISEADAPKTWKSLTDPKYKGKMVMPDPHPAGGGNIVLWDTVNTPSLGLDFAKGLAQQNILMVRGSGDRDATVARGERAIAIAADPRGLGGMKDVPVKWVAPEEGIVRTVFVAGLVKDAPAPNAARVFMNWLLSTDYQSAAAKEIYDVPSVKGVTGNPLGLSAETEKLLGPGALPPDKFNEAVALANQVFGR